MDPSVEPINHANNADLAYDIQQMSEKHLLLSYKAPNVTLGGGKKKQQQEFLEEKNINFTFLFTQFYYFVNEV